MTGIRTASTAAYRYEAEQTVQMHLETGIEVANTAEPDTGIQADTATDQKKESRKPLHAAA